MKREELPYRQSTLAIVINKDGKFLVVNKQAYEPDKWWSFPGGGVDEGETPEQAVMRELVEELESDKFEIAGKSKNEYQYEWPDEVIEKTHKEKGKYFRGTQLTQFWVKFSGNEREVKAGDGIRAIKWVTRDELKNYLLFPNQLENAEKVIKEFIK
jgi:mutator protein MutT